MRNKTFFIHLIIVCLFNLWASESVFSLNLHFEDLSLGSSYDVGDSIYSVDIPVIIEPFYPLGGSPMSGKVTVENLGQGGGFGNELEIDNANLKIIANTQSLTMFFYHGGGDINLGINDDVLVCDNFHDLPCYIGGAWVSVRGDPDYPCIMDITGQISTFTIGGEKVFIDNIELMLESDLYLTFEDQVLGATYCDGDSFLATPGTKITVNGQGWVEVGNFGMAGGFGIELEIHYANLTFQPAFSGCPPDGMSLTFGDFGGDINFGISGDLHNADDFNDLTGYIGITSINASHYSNNYPVGALVAIGGDIKTFTIGGQELYIDNVKIYSYPGECSKVFIYPSQSYSISSKTLSLSAYVNDTVYGDVTAGSIEWFLLDSSGIQKATGNLTYNSTRGIWLASKTISGGLSTGNYTVHYHITTDRGRNGAAVGQIFVETQVSATNNWDGKKIRLLWPEGKGRVCVVRTDVNGLDEHIFESTDANSFTDNEDIEPGKTYKYVLKSVDLGKIISNEVEIKAEAIVVLVRGYSPWGSGYDADYWGEDVNSWFEERGVTCWDASAYLNGAQSIAWNANALKAFINSKLSEPLYQTNPPTKVNLVGHSMGGLISRQYANTHPGFVDKIFCIHTPHTGSTLADIYGYWPMNPATWDLRPDSLESFNKKFKDLDGTKLYAFWSINYTDNANDKALKVAHAIMSPDQRFRSGILGAGNDGAVPKLSEVGQIRERLPLLPLPVWILKQKVQIDDSANSGLDHYTCYRHPDTLEKIMDWMGLSESQAQSMQMAFEANADGNEPQVVPLHFVAGFEGQLDSNTPITQTAPICNSSTAYFRAIISDANCSFTLSDPCGTIYDSCYAFTDPNVTYETEDEIFLYEVNSPIPGTWTLNLSTTIAPPNSVDYGLTVFEDTNIALYSYTDLDWANTNDDISIHAMMTENDVPIVDADLIADITLPDTNTILLLLYDDGLHNDVNDEDGIYANTFSSTNQVGIYNGQVSATGTWAGTDFKRTSPMSFTISSPDIYFLGDINDFGIDLNANGFYDILKFTVPVNVNEPNEFLLTATLFDSNDNIIKMLSTGDVNLPAGPNTFTLEVSAEDIVKHDVNGPYTLSSITISDANIGLTIAATTDYNTASYLVTDFEPLDTDGEGLADVFELAIGTDVNLPDSDYDGLTDYEEISYDGDANSYNSAADLSPLNTDTDNDGMSDSWELYYNFDALNDDGAKNNDDDYDGLTNLQEYQNNTDPNNTDSDFDGTPDGWEVDFDLNPAFYDSSNDGDEDNLINLLEYQYNTDPNKPDTDIDGIVDGNEVHIYHTDPNDDDTDDDSILDGPDNCKLMYNPEQTDVDSDGEGDTCEADISGNHEVDFLDFTILASRWLDSFCGDCDGADLDGEEDVDFADLSIFAEYWLEGAGP